MTTLLENHPFFFTKEEKTTYTLFFFLDPSKPSFHISIKLPANASKPVEWVYILEREYPLDETPAWFQQLLGSVQKNSPVS